MDLSKVSWISLHNCTRLQQLGILTVDDLLRVGNTDENRAILAAQLKVSQRMVTRWVCSADIARIKGIDNRYASILARTKVRTLDDLAKQNVDSLHEQIKRLNSTYRMVRRLPGKSTISRWIVDAQKLPRVISHEQSVAR